MHLIALGLKKKFNIPWIADFRDPWTNIDFYDQLMLSAGADAKHRRLEKEVLQHADKIVTVSKSWSEDFKKICGKDITVITNGYDDEDFSKEKPLIKNEFAFHHIGALNKDRNPIQFWKALGRAVKEIPELKSVLKIRLVGKTDFSVFESVKENGLDAFVERVEYIPHNEIISFVCSSPILLLPLNDTPNIMGIIPGKLFEYLAAKRPIFCIGNPHGDTPEIIRETASGVVFNFTDEEGIRAGILKFYEDFKSGKLAMPMGSGIEKYSRREGARKYSEELSHFF